MYHSRNYRVQPCTPPTDGYGYPISLDEDQTQTQVDSAGRFALGLLTVFYYSCISGIYHYHSHNFPIPDTVYHLTSHYSGRAQPCTPPTDGLGYPIAASDTVEVKRILDSKE